MFFLFGGIVLDSGFEIGCFNVVLVIVVCKLNFVWKVFLCKYFLLKRKCKILIVFWLIKIDKKLFLFGIGKFIRLIG